VLAVAVASLLTLAVPAQSAASAPSPPAQDPLDVHLVAASQDDVNVPTTVVDELRDGDVIRVYVTAGEPDAAGTVAQCRIAVDTAARCDNQFPVRFGPEGEAAFQYQLRDDGQCDASSACAMVVRDDAGKRIASTWIVFGEAVRPAPTVRLVPDGPRRPGSEIVVEVTGASPASTLSVAICGERCAPVTSLAIGDGGTGDARLRVPENCSHCRLVVAGAAKSVVVLVDLTTPPGPRYDPWRVAAGLLAAVLLLLTAWRIVATTDWRPPSEANVPDVS
jgi:hypothetical protein